MPKQMRTFRYPTLAFDKCVVTSDWHIPYHSERWVSAMLDEAFASGIRDILIIGDFLDLASLSRFEPREIDGRVEDELDAAATIIDRCRAQGRRLHWFRGNHELRFFRAMKHEVTLDALAAMIGIPMDREALHTYDQETVEVMSGGTTWTFTHPQSYNSVPLNTARKLNHTRGGNIGTAHNHLFGMAVAPNGRDTLVELGGLFDRHKLAYLNVGGLSNYPVQANGYWILKDGGLYLPDNFPQDGRS